MISLVEVLGRSFGLPDNPTDRDFEDILDGTRRISIEAEDALEDTSEASVKSFEALGPFTGTGWVNAAASGAKVQLHFNIPLAGTYRINVHVQGKGHRVSLEGADLRADGAETFTAVDVGEVDLLAGAQSMELSLPPNGSIDRIELQAPALRRVAPAQGWQPNAPLTREVLARTLAEAARIDDLLPKTGASRKIEIESATEKGTARISREHFLGEPSEGAWLRAAAATAKVRIPFRLDKPGTYLLTLKSLGNAPITAQANNRQSFTIPPAPYLTGSPLGTLFLQGGENLLELSLPPGCGADVLMLEELDSSAQSYMAVTGPLSAADLPTFQEVDRILEILFSLAAKD